MALSLARDISDDDRHATWIRVAERIYQEQIRQGWRHRMFRLVRGVFNTNSVLAAEGGFIFDWLAENDVDASLMVVRRELDLQAGTENLRNLLEDIIEHSGVLTRARYVAQWPPDEAPRASEMFDSFNPLRGRGSPECDHIDPSVVQSDLDRAVGDAQRLLTYAERTRAHRTPEAGIDALIMFKELHQAISDIRLVVRKYYALLTLKMVAQWELEPQFDTMSPFTRPWVIDPKAAAAAAKEKSQEQ